MARVFRDWHYFPLDCLLLAGQDGQLGIVSARSNTKTSTLLSRCEVLLEIADWNVRDLVSGMLSTLFSTLRKHMFSLRWPHADNSQYDFVTIPNAVFSGTIISTIVPDGDVRGTAEWQLLLGALALPGVILGALLLDIIGRKRIMMIGFGGYLVFGLIIGCAFDQISGILPLFVIFYGIMLSLGNFGPGNLLGIISTESYATAVRGTCYGLSAAVGKVCKTRGESFSMGHVNATGSPEITFPFLSDLRHSLIQLFITIRQAQLLALRYFSLSRITLASVGLSS